MKAKGQARVGPPRKPRCATTGYCMLAMGYMESGVVDVSTVAEIRK